MQLIAVYMLVYMGVDKGKQAVMSKGRNQMQNALARDKSPSFWCTGKAVLCDCVSVLPFGASGRQCFVILSLSFLLVPRKAVLHDYGISCSSFWCLGKAMLHDYAISCPFWCLGKLCFMIMAFPVFLLVPREGCAT